MNPRDAADALETLVVIAREAGALLLRGHRTGTHVDYKGEIDLVTEFDRSSEALIRTRVAREFPEWDVVAEEAGGTVRGDRPVLYADPLDGTTNYAHGHPFFAVSLGVMESSGAILGVVFAPALGWIHAGGPGLGATRNGIPCRVSATAALDRALLATGFPYDRRTSPENNFVEFIALKKRAQGVRRCGAASLDLCMVADGTYDGYWEQKLQPWDLAAGAAIVLGAGGTVTSYDGGPADARTGSLIASNGAIHDELRRAVVGSQHG